MITLLTGLLCYAYIVGAFTTFVLCASLEIRPINQIIFSITWVIAMPIVITILAHDAMS